MKNKEDQITRFGDLTVFMAADYSQIEIRMLAEVTGDPLLIKQFQSGQDIHSLVGHILTGWPVEKIKADEAVRRSIKGFHFGIVYGIGEPSLYRNLKAEGVKIRRRQLHGYFTRYFEMYKGVARYMKEMPKLAERQHFVETIFGFRRTIQTSSVDEKRGTYWGNQSINTPIQGAAHQLMLIAMALLHLKPKTYNLLQRPVAEVHDALYWYVKLRDIAVAYQQVTHLLQEGVVQYVAKKFGRNLRVPLRADVKVGYCLGSMVNYAGGSVPEFLANWREYHREVQRKGWDALQESL